MCNQVLTRALVEVPCLDRGLYFPKPVDESVILYPGPLPPTPQKEIQESPAQASYCAFGFKGKRLERFTRSMCRVTTEGKK